MRWSIASSIVVGVVAAIAQPAAAEPTGHVRVTLDGATDEDATKLRDIAKNLEGAVTWRAGGPKRTKKFRLRVHARGGVRGLTELRSTVAKTATADDHGAEGVVICKLVRNRLWSARLKGAGAARTVTVTFTFTPR